MFELYDKAHPKYKGKHVIDDGMHNTGWANDLDAYFGAIDEFI